MSRTKRVSAAGALHTAFSNNQDGASSAAVRRRRHQMPNEKPQEKCNAIAVAVPADIVGDVLKLMNPQEAVRLGSVCRCWRDPVLACDPTLQPTPWMVLMTRSRFSQSALTAGDLDEGEGNAVCFSNSTHIRTIEVSYDSEKRHPFVLTHVNVDSNRGGQQAASSGISFLQEAAFSWPAVRSGKHRLGVVRGVQACPCDLAVALGPDFSGGAALGFRRNRRRSAGRPAVVGGELWAASVSKKTNTREEEGSRFAQDSRRLLSTCVTPTCGWNRGTCVAFGTCGLYVGWCKEVSSTA